MYALPTILLLSAVLQVAVQAQFVPPSEGPLVASTNYVGASNGSLPKTQLVPGKAFNRIINIWLENTDFLSAVSSVAFNELASQGILLDQYCAVTHPSEPNYIGAIGGDFFGLSDDNLYHIPPNISTVVDLLEAKNISWASYQENMPYDGFEGFNFSSKNYVNTSAPDYVFYWVFVTPNMVNDGHDTSVDYAGQWLDFWLVPLLSNPNFNDDQTLVVLAFDENESYTENNCVLTLLLGDAVPQNLRGTTDSTYFTHYSLLSTVEANWGLGSLGRGDTNKTLSNVFSFVADATGYTNTDVSSNSMLTNATGTIPGPLNPVLYVPFTAPNTAAVGAGGGPVFIGPGLDTSFTADVAPPPVNLTAQNKTVPWLGPRTSS
ncbi:hypothetical protein F5148DRAFT_212367 [Russula earlei]|uniref:Uncharacterized protein n=1 Tax=Russula earlei TaxID=71964 RepID=A0ACC0U585_9AGAM|nr:hypothetical protein F5148DRAFT_212367 [Russula earlei]